jgi:hypothetical protein
VNLLEPFKAKKRFSATSSQTSLLPEPNWPGRQTWSSRTEIRTGTLIELSVSQIPK